MAWVPELNLIGPTGSTGNVGQNAWTPVIDFPACVTQSSIRAGTFYCNDIPAGAYYATVRSLETYNTFYYSFTKEEVGDDMIVEADTGNIQNMIFWQFSGSNATVSAGIH